MKTVLIGLGMAVLFWIAVHVADAVLLRVATDAWVTEELNYRVVLYPQQVIVACLVVGMIAAAAPRWVGRD